jgi:hypothetical protein
MPFEHGPQLDDLSFSAGGLDSYSDNAEQKETKQPGLLKDNDLVVDDFGEHLSLSKKLLSKIGVSVKEIPLRDRDIVDKDAFVPGLIILRIIPLKGESHESIPLERAQEAVQYLRSNGVPTANVGYMFRDDLSQSSQEP